MEEYIYRILHKPSGLFYCSRKGSWKESITNLSVKGEFYLNYNRALKVLQEDCGRAFINKSQVEKFNLPIIKNHSSFSKALEEDFVIKKYTIKEVEQSDD